MSDAQIRLYTEASIRVVERRQLAESGHNLLSQDIGVIGQRIRSYFEHINRLCYPI